MLWDFLTSCKQRIRSTRRIGRSNDEERRVRRSQRSRTCFRYDKIASVNPVGSCSEFNNTHVTSEFTSTARGNESRRLSEIADTLVASCSQGKSAGEVISTPFT
eukprot:644630-Hanusia_phi.AAC.2